ncbi:hypothetical protein LUZ60_013017 [Juncus effusus]|nr:hypothetical protein LUZ60_013017 [Juncus effusus]
MPPPVPSFLFLKSVTSPLSHLHPPPPPPPRFLTLNLAKPPRVGVALAAAVVPSRRLWSGWMQRGSVTALRALDPSKNGYGSNLRFGSDLKRGEKAEAMGGGADPGLDPIKRVADGEEVVVNGVCKNEDKTKLLTLPTVLTIGRVLAVPLLITTFYMEREWAATATTSIFLIAAITDWLDGYIARKMKLGSAFGAFLDPVADKLMVAATLVLLCTRPFEVPGFGQVSWLLTVPSIAIIGREITMSAVREWAASQNKKLLEAVAVNNLGKWKTATQMTALTVLLLTRDPSLSGQSSLIGSGVALLYISAGLAVWSLVVYVKKISGVLLKV